MLDIIAWSAVAGGAAIGAYLILQFWITGKALGCSRSYGNPWNLCSRLPLFQSKDYEFSNWRLWFILGIPLGGFISVLLSTGELPNISWSMGEIYERLLPENDWAKTLWLIVGGILIGLGARMAGGCTSGHVITGVSQLNPISLLAAILFFIGGALMVNIINLMV